MRRIKGLKFLIWFIGLTGGFLFAFDYMGLELTRPIVIAVLGFSVMIAGMISMYSKGIFHQGHFPMLMGIVFIIVGGVMFWGTLTFSWTDDTGTLQTKPQWWDLTPQESGVFILLVIVGIWSFISGFKQMMGASYFLGNIVGRRR